MIQFTKVEFQNFGSFGNTPTTIHLNRHRTTLVSGMNGHGKSFALLDSITFGLFGKPFRKINIPQLPNSINEKNCRVQVDFSIGEDEYTVVRGIKPKIFEIHKNGKMLNQNSKSKDYQRMLEEHILKMNFKSFTQVVILGSSSFIPFMQLTAADRRSVIEDILDIQVFSDMNVIAKQRWSNLKEEINDLMRTKEIIRNKIDVLKKHIANIEKEDNTKIDAIQEEIVKVEHVIDTDEKLIDKLLEKQESIVETSKEIDTQKTLLGKYKGMKAMIGQSKTGRLNKYNQLHDVSECPTCTQSIEADVKKEILGNLQKRIDEYDEGLKGIEVKIVETERIVDDLNKLIKLSGEINREVINKRASVAMAKAYLDKQRDHVEVIRKKRDDVSEDSLDAELESTTQELMKTQDKEGKLKEEHMLHGLVFGLLKDNGIKSKIIRHYLPLMNKLINKYLTDMGFFARFYLDENFNETIKSRHRDTFSYMSFSEGEKMRIDLALLLSWREIARIKNSANTNLLILDEVFDSSLDTVGTDEFMKLMSVLSANTHVFVISHKSDQLVDKFDNHITFVKNGNFSKIA